MQVKQLLTRTAGALGVTAGLLFVGSPLMAQVKIGDNPNTINPNSILELESTTKGLLTPRVALTATNAVAPMTSPVPAGMRVFNTATTSGDFGVSPGEYYYDGTNWVRLVTQVPAGMEVYREGAPTVGGACGADPEGTIWNDISDNSTGQQWICRGGVWAVYDAPQSFATPFNFDRVTDGKQVDAGPRKSGTIYRYGIITTQNGPLAAGPGSASLYPSGVLRLLRVATAAQPSQGPLIDFGRNPANPSLFRISLRNDLNGGNGALAFNTTIAGNTVARMVMGINGQIGINTTDPLRLLHINGSTLITTAGTDGTEFSGGTSLRDGILMYYGQPDDTNDNRGRAQIFVQSTGDVPNLVLTKRTGAVDDPFIRFGTSAVSNLGSIVRLAGNTVGFGSTSDRRLKENIKSTHFTIDDLMKVGVVDYNYISDENKTLVTGFIAQDLFKIFPNAVVKGGDDVKTKPWMVDYSKVTPLLVKAIQDQQKKIQSLEAQLSEMNALKAEVASIKAMLGNAAQQNSEATISK